MTELVSGYNSRKDENACSKSALIERGDNLGYVGVQISQLSIDVDYWAVFN